MTRKIGMTVGEPCGIGPQLCVRLLERDLPSGVEVTLYGSPKLLSCEARRWNIGLERPGVRIVPVGPDQEEFPTEDLHLRARAVLASLDRAIEDALKGEVSSILTAPLDKGVVRTLLPRFVGHTEYLAEKSGVRRTVMMLDNTELRVVLLTHHIPLRDVPKAIRRDDMEEVLRLAEADLKKWFGITKPKMVVAGLNPHAGEIVDESEEDTIFAPVIRKLQTEGWAIEGPYSADSLFAKARGNHWDLVISPYHDQGLTAIKYPGLEKVVNITLGLPYLRTSPGHGVAYDIPRGKPADLRSFERAFRIACERRFTP